VEDGEFRFMEDRLKDEFVEGEVRGAAERVWGGARLRNYFCSG